MSIEPGLSYRAGRFKICLAKLAGSAQVGRVVSRLFANRLPSHGIWLDTSHKAFTDPVKARIFWQIYEAAEIRYIRRNLVGVETIVELGSSLGISSAHCLDVMDPDGRFIAVEANDRLLEPLRLALLRHAVGQTVEVVHAAISTSASAVQFETQTESVAGRIGRGTSVTATSLSELLEEKGVDEFVLVADIEGAEADLVFNDAPALARCTAAVLELHDTKMSDGRICSQDLILRQLESSGLSLIEARGPVCYLARR